MDVINWLIEVKIWLIPWLMWVINGLMGAIHAVINGLKGATYWLMDGMFFHIKVKNVIIILFDDWYGDLLSIPYGAVCMFFVILLQHYFYWEEISEAFYALFRGEFIHVWHKMLIQKGCVLITAIVFFCFYKYRRYKKMPWWFVVGWDEDEPNPDDGLMMDEITDDEFDVIIERGFEINYAYEYSKRDFDDFVARQKGKDRADIRKARRKKKKLEAFREKWKERILKEEEYQLMLEEDEKERMLLYPKWRLFLKTKIKDLKNKIVAIKEKRRAEKLAKKEARLRWALLKQDAVIRYKISQIPVRRKAKLRREALERARERAREKAFVKQFRKDMREFRIILAIEKLKNEAAFKQQQEWHRRFYKTDAKDTTDAKDKTKTDAKDKTGR